MAFCKNIYGTLILSCSVIIANYTTTNAAVTHKGIQAWGYIDSNLSKAGGDLIFKWEDDDDTVSQVNPENMYGQKCWENIGNKDSYFKIDFEPDPNRFPNGPDGINRTAEVNNKTGVATMTGVTGLSSSDMDMENIWSSDGGSGQKTKFGELNGNKYTFSYGMYADGPDDVDLDDPLGGHHQAYSYVTGDLSQWMTDIRNQAISKFGTPDKWDNSTLGSVVFPGAHDAGMFELKSSIQTPGKASQMVTTMAEHGIGFAAALLAAEPAIQPQGVFNILQNTALTQKDITKDQLRAGIRYFDYRPATVKDNLFPPIDHMTPGQYNHIHSFIPGYDFSSFMTDVTNFLSENGQEIVIVNVKDPGASQDVFDPVYPTQKSGQPPSQTDFDNARSIIQDLLKNSPNANSVDPMYVDTYSGLADLTIGDLVSSKQRLIFYFGTGYNDSYDESYYNTYDPSKVTKAMGNVHDLCVKDTTNYTVFQMQDTATDTLKNPLNYPSEKGEMANVLGSVNGSLTLSTKGLFDNATVPWVTQYVASCKTMTVLLNDFVGNLTALTAKRLTKYRMGLDDAPTLGNQVCSGMEN